MPGDSSSGRDQVRTAEVIAALCLATDLGMGLPFEHGLHSTLFAMRLAERLGVDSGTAAQTYYGCLLFYSGCTADAEITAELFQEGALLTHFAPVMFGTRAETMAGIMRALASPGSAPPIRALQAASRLPRAVRGHRRHIDALCEVAQMLSDRLGLPRSVRGLFVHLTERWDGKGEPAGLKGEEIPLPLRIIHVARDAAFQRLLGGEEHAVRVVRERAGHAFDPAIATRLADEATDIMAPDDERSAWDETLAAEPAPRLTLQGEEIDQALAAMGDFADLASPYLVGHSAGVAELATAAAQRCRFEAADLVAMRRASLVHDVGRVAVPARIWQKAAPLTADEWERVRLHAYHSERVLCRSPFTAQRRSQASAGDGLDERPSPWIFLPAWAGIIGPVLFTVTFLAQEAFRIDEYSPLAEPVSALEAGPNGWVQQVNFVVFGLLTLAFAVGLHRGLRPARAGIVGPALLFVSGIGLLLAAIFPLREDAAGVTYDPGGHFFAGITFFLSSSVG